MFQGVFSTAFCKITHKNVIFNCFQLMNRLKKTLHSVFFVTLFMEKTPCDKVAFNIIITIKINLIKFSILIYDRHKETSQHLNKLVSDFYVPELYEYHKHFRSISNK